MECLICTSGASTGFFSTLFHSTVGLLGFGCAMAAMIAVMLFACYRIGVAYTKQTQAEIDEAVARGVVTRGKLG